MSGVIYILTNPSFPEYVKIGYADDIDARLNQLNRSECIPFAFRVYATYEVNNRLVDLKLHDLIDRLNPTLRSIETFNGKQRKREFYAMSPESAYALLEGFFRDYIPFSFVLNSNKLPKSSCPFSTNENTSFNCVKKPSKVTLDSHAPNLRAQSTDALTECDISGRNESESWMSDTSPPTAPTCKSSS